MTEVGIRYSKNHIWVRVEDDYVFIGLTEFFLENIDEIIEINLPKKGEDIVTEEPFGSIDTGSELVDLVAPISGEVVKINKKVVNDPAILLEDPMGDGWLLKVEPFDWEEIEGLLTEDEYESNIE